MPRRPRPPAFLGPLLLWQDLALGAGDMLAASAQVIGHRTRRMVAAGHSPSASDRREFSRMGLEKIEAAGESIGGMAQQLAKLNLQLYARAWEDLVASNLAWLAFTGSRTWPQVASRQRQVLHSASRASASAAQLSGAAARVVRQGLEPIHARATANARRLGRRR